MSRSFPTRRPPGRLVALLALLTTFLAAPAARASGLLVADGGFGGKLEIVSQDVAVTVNNGVAVTHVDQTFRNTENRVVEALYVFPVPRGASVADFSMWINGKEMTGEVVEKQRAREIYESYKQKRRDPGLLEQVDYRTFEMRIFPIPAGAEQRVKLSYYQELDVDHDAATYVYPLATGATDGKADTTVHGRFSFKFDAKSAVPITSLSSPSHGGDFSVTRPAETFASASLELTEGDLSKDVVLRLEAKRAMTGLDFVANKPAGEDGYFQLTLTAGDELAKASDAGMDYVFVLDVSGSMGGDRKLELSLNAARQFVDGLGEKDRFEVLTFNNALASLFNNLTATDDTAKKKAAEFLDAQRARGGTQLRPAFEAAYRYATDADRPLNVVVLSDGLAEQGTAGELVNLINRRPKNARVFCVGVGNDVNRPLLEQVAQESGGLAAFVSPQDDLARAAAAFRRKLMRPVAADLQLKFAGTEVYDVTPAKLPDLYHGMPVRVYGRYKKGGDVNVTLAANVEGRSVEQKVGFDLPAKSDADPEIERMWAWKRVDELLKQSDRDGGRSQSTISEVVRLGEAYSIATEYTSFIVLENDAEYRRWNIERRNALRVGRDRAAQAQTREAMERLRDRAAQNIGPAPTPAAEPVAAKRVDVMAPAPTPQVRDTSRDFSFTRPSNRNNGGGGGGGGAFDPRAAIALLGIAGVALVATWARKGER